LTFYNRLRGRVKRHSEFSPVFGKTQILFPAGLQPAFCLGSRANHVEQMPKNAKPAWLFDTRIPKAVFEDAFEAWWLG
jgi:hypothetical protein